MSRLTAFLLACSVCLATAALSQTLTPPQPSPGENLARGQACTFDPVPNYGLCTDPGDATDLTDGVYNHCEWREKGTVGWNVGRTRAFTISLDLGSEQPIGQITFDTVTGGAQVTFPSAVLAFVSTDGKDYRFVGDVLTEALPQTSFLNHRFRLEHLKAWGRYVKLVALPGGFYLFCDEIEVMKGDHTPGQAQFAEDKPIAAAQVTEYALGRAGWVNQKNATLTLLRYATAAVADRKAKGAPEAACAAAEKAIAEACAGVLTANAVAEANYEAGVPYRGLEGKAFAAVGALNASVWPGKPVIVWQDAGWNWLKPLDAPDKPGGDVRVDMMMNEWASTSLNLTSAATQPSDLTVTVADFTGPQQLAADQVVKLAQVIHTEATGYNYRDDALVPLVGGKLSLAAGLTKRLWLTFKTRGQELKPGVYASTLTLSGHGRKLASVPVRLRVWPLRFPDQPTCESNSWGYFNESVIVGHEPTVAQDLVDHYNTSLVLNHSYLPYPKPDAQGNFTEPLDFTKLDQMLAWNSRCRMWLLWAGWEFGFDRLGTAQFGGALWEKVFTQWVTQVRDHLLAKGLRKDQFAWYWIDEPGDKVWLERCVPTSQLLKAIDPEMLTWENPTETVTPKMLEAALPYFDLYCPSIAEIANAERVRVCGQTRRPSWAYACASEKNSDPSAYYRWLSWKAFQGGFGGVGMWVYVDANCATPSDYTSGTSYALIYGWDQGIVDSKRWEAWRQGIADFEYLTMLRSAVQKARRADKPHPDLAAAEEVLAKSVEEVCGTSEYMGDAERPQLADQWRRQILESLEALGKK